MDKHNAKRVSAMALGVIGWLFLSASSAAAFTWWNPMTWFKSSEAVKTETLKYKAERPGYVETLEEARMTGDPETIRLARQELRDFDKAHDRRLREIRKKEHAEMRQAHKDAHKDAVKEKKESRIKTAKGDRRETPRTNGDKSYKGFGGHGKGRGK